MTAIYIAARFSRRPEAHELSKRLRERGHTITSRWVRPGDDHVLPTGLSAQAADAERTRFATEDCADVTACDCMVSLMEEPRSNGRGGRHVEFGMALGLGKRLVIIGSLETVFHHLPQVVAFRDEREFLQALDDGFSLAPAGHAHSETSAEIASLAGSILNEQPQQVERVTAGRYNTLLAQAKRLAGSALAQREAE